MAEIQFLQAGQSLDTLHVLQGDAVVQPERFQSGQSLQAVHIFERGARAEIDAVWLNATQGRGDGIEIAQPGLRIPIARLDGCFPTPALWIFPEVR